MKFILRLWVECETNFQKSVYLFAFDYCEFTGQCIGTYNKMTGSGRVMTFKEVKEGQ